MGIRSKVTQDEVKKAISLTIYRMKLSKNKKIKEGLEIRLKRLHRLHNKADKYGLIFLK